MANKRYRWTNFEFDAVTGEGFIAGEETPSGMFFLTPTWTGVSYINPANYATAATAAQIKTAVYLALAPYGISVSTYVKPGSGWLWWKAPDQYQIVLFDKHGKQLGDPHNAGAMALEVVGQGWDAMIRDFKAELLRSGVIGATPKAA